MRKTLVIIAALAGLALAPQAQAHDDRVGIFVVGAITGAVIGHVLGDHDHHHHHPSRLPSARGGTSSPLRAAAAGA